MAEEQGGDDDAFLYGEDAEQEVNRQDEVAEAANGGGASEELPVRCSRRIFEYWPQRSERSEEGDERCYSPPSQAQLSFACLALAVILMTFR